MGSPSNKAWSEDGNSVRSPRNEGWLADVEVWNLERSQNGEALEKLLGVGDSMGSEKTARRSVRGKVG